MPLSERTIAEMTAGAQQVARNAGQRDLTPEQMTLLVATQDRMRLLKAWEHDGDIRVEWIRRVHTSDRGGGLDDKIYFTTVHVGRQTFNDIGAEQAGCFPSELLIANIALALAAGQGDKDTGIESGTSQSA